MAVPTELVLRTDDMLIDGKRPDYTVTLDGVHLGKRPFGTSHRQEVVPGRHSVRFEAHVPGSSADGEESLDVEVEAENRTTVTYEITVWSEFTVRGETRTTTGWT